METDVTHIQSNHKHPSIQSYYHTIRPHLACKQQLIEFLVIFLCLYCLFARWVWSSAGGWWCHPYHWRRNTAIVGLGVTAVSLWLYQWGERSTGYIDLAHQTVHFAPNDDRRAAQERRERRKRKASIEKGELGERPTLREETEE